MNPVRTTKVVAVLAALVAAVAFAGCDDRPGVFDRPLEYHGGHVLAGAYLAWDSTAEAYVRLGLGTDDVRSVRHVAVPEGARQETVTEDGEALLVLTPESTALSRVGVDDEEATIYELGEPFGQMVLSDDGRFVVVYGGDVVNQSLLSFVDLNEPPGDDNPVARSISSYGGVRHGIDLSPEFELAGETRRLAVVRSTGHLALLDPAVPGETLVRVPLVVPGDPVDVVPRLVRFAPRSQAGGGLWVFVTAGGSGDIFALEISPALADSDDPYHTELNLHAVGDDVADAVPVRTADGRLHVVGLARYARSLVMVDVETGTSRSFAPSATYGSLLLVPAQGDAGQQLLLTQSGGTQFSVLDVEAVAERGAKALRDRTLPSRYDSVELVPGTDRFVAFDDTTNRVTLGWLGHDADNVVFQLPDRRKQHAMTDDGTHLVLLTGTQNYLSDWELVSIDLDSGSTARLPLGDRVTGMALVPGGGPAVVTYTDQAGRLLVAQPADLEGDTTETIAGFLLEGVLGW